ncbi:hypothetical protein GTW66_12515 [Streptomyces sp. SID5473]|nr:hypothetical protein [Streptomyces tsukubensis NRRL18488]MYS64867.1 hypothetical protein [Streptomyces sp. SID5473]
MAQRAQKAAGQDECGHQGDRERDDREVAAPCREVPGAAGEFDGTARGEDRGGGDDLREGSAGQSLG